MFDTVVLAGGGKADSLAASEGVANKAFIMFGRKPLLALILEALDSAPSVGKIIVAGPENELKNLQDEGYHFEISAEKATILENLAAAFTMVDRDRLCLVTTGDIPMLNTGAVEKFIGLCAPHDDDLYYPVLSRETCQHGYPDAKRTYVQLKEGYVTGGNLFLIKPAWFLNHRDQLELFISYRKKPLKLLRILPPGLIVKYLLKKLSLADLENFVLGLLDLKVRAVLCECAEIGLDVDKISDLEQARKLLQGS